MIETIAQVIGFGGAAMNCLSFSKVKEKES